MENQEFEKTQKLSLITEEDRIGNSDMIKAEIREKVINEIEVYLNHTKKINILDIAKQLGVSWVIANDLVSKVTEKWRQEDHKKLQKARKIVFEKLDDFLTNQVIALDFEKDMSKKSAKIDELTRLLRNLKDIEELEDNPVKTATDSSRVVAVHFNNMNLTPSSMDELDKTKKIENENQQ